MRVSRHALIVALAVIIGGCGQDGDLLQYRILQNQPTSVGLGVLVEVLASPAGHEHRGLFIDLQMGTLEVGGTIQELPFYHIIGDGRPAADNLSGEDVARLLLTVIPTDQEALLTLSLRDNRNSMNAIDTIQTPIKKPVGNGSGSGGM